MSESQTPGVSVTPEPAPGTSPAAPVEAGAPALSPTPDPAPSEAPAADASTESVKAPSLLSGATAPDAGDKAAVVAPAETPPAETEAAADKPADQADKPAEVAPPTAEAPLPTYEAFKVPEGFTVDDEKIGDFGKLLGEHERRIIGDPTTAHTAFQELGQAMMDLYARETQATAERMAQQRQQEWERGQEQRRAEFRDDPELGRNQADTTIARLGSLLDAYGNQVGPTQLQSLRDELTLSGAGNSVHVLRFVNWAATRLVERPRIIAAPPSKTPVTVRSRAERLYGKTGA